jgi:predicted permease
VVIATLALAIGANTAVFTVVHGLLLRTLPYDAPERIVRIDPMAPRDILEDHPAIEVHASYAEDAGANLVEGFEASRIRLAQVSADFIRVMGVAPILGSAWAGDEGPGQALLAHGLWRRAFGGDQDVVGRRFSLGGRFYRVAGVLPPGVDVPAGAEMWVSLPLVNEFYGGAIGRRVVARLKAGVLPTQLESDLQARARDAMAGEDVPEEYWLPRVVPLMGDLTRAARLPLLILCGAAALVLLLGCANVAGMTLARLSAREQEFGVRRALGAGRARVFVQLAAEAALPAAFAGALSVGLAIGGVAAIRRVLPPETPNLSDLSPGPELLWATALATVLAAAMTGLLPALHAARGLRPPRAGAAATTHPGQQRLQGGLVVTQIALAVVLVTGAALMARSLARLYDVPLGFDVDRVLTFEVRLPRQAYPDDASWRSYQERAEAALRTVPAVNAVGATSRLPLADGLSFGYVVRPEGSTETEGISALFVSVSPKYFESIGTHMLEGAPSNAVGRQEAVLSRSLARALFPEGPAAGRRFHVYTGPRDQGTSARVAGVVEDVRRRGPEQGASGFVVYEPLARSPRPYLGFAIRYGGSVEGLVSAVREALRRVDPSVPPFRVRTTGQAVAATLAARRSVAVVSSLFGAIALLLASLGVYGLMSHAVSRRRRELGIRMALGAASGRITGMVLRRGLALAGVGSVLGVLGALAATRVLAGLLYEVSTTDPVTFVAAPSILLAAAAAACWFPARRAASTDPVSSLRAE